MAPGSAGGVGGDGDKDAKNMFDRIGEEVYKKVHTAAKQYTSELHGVFTLANLSNGGTVMIKDPCQLNHEYHTNVTVGQGKENPCFGRQRVRFSDIHGAYCSRSRIKGNNTGHGRACAPFRRLHLCDQNLEQIEPKNINTTHNLLVDVCLAARHEGESLVKKYKEYKEQNSDFDTGICTVLARSFADIGDIVRGRDLYLGHQQKKTKLETSLKGMFENIKKNNEKLKRLENEEVREYWWALNRQKVWKAMICKAPNDAKYFRQTACDGGSGTESGCHCIAAEVPTYFDYVPQYLRWFEEWAEDFCRKKKKKLPHVRTNCRGNDSMGEPRYCSRNGYDCEQTISRIGKVRIDKGCTDCFFACNPYIDWIDNKKKEFLKQKEKYQKEIEKYTQKKGLSDNVNDKYDKQFYEILQREKGDFGEFLELLNNETECKDITNKEEGKINFTEDHDDKNNNENKGTFYRSKYCQPCPDCGVKKGNNGEFQDKDTSKKRCEGDDLYVPSGDAKVTEIKILNSGEETNEIEQKLEAFCKTPSNSSLYELWKCYFQDNHKEACILKKQIEVNKNDEIQKPYNDFFTFWVTHMLKDSIYWRTKLKKCLKNVNKSCLKKCNGDCECYKKWVKQKKDEWNSIEQHFEKQGLTKEIAYTTLQMTFQLFFMKQIEKAYGEEDSKELKQKLDQNDVLRLGADTKNAKFAIDILLDHEEQEAGECVTNNPKDNCDTGGLGRTLEAHRPTLVEEEFSDSDDDEAPKPQQSRKNPCSGDKSGDKLYPVLAHKVAEDIHKKAHKEMKENSVDSKGKNMLKADASLGKYNGKFNGSELSSNICSINEHEHSNRNAGDSKGPCGGKGPNRFKIGEQWKTSPDLQIKDPQLFLPPRREHMCTSNLEYLLRPTYGSLMQVGNGKFNHSFLGDVLNAAKSEAEDIINKYKENKGNSGQNTKNGLEGDQATTCRSIRYSFADIGDIIRGRDLWEHNEQTRLQGHLQTIFEKIKGELKDIDTSKYNGDTKHKQLREDWWEANRDQVWNAMKCPKNGVDITCDNGVPYDDYIPQRLRWMTEWAEWYCKYQYQEYEKLWQKCWECKSGTCTKDSDGSSKKQCEGCTQACKEYQTQIDKWRKQWTQMDMKYTISYLSAQDNHAGKAYPGADYQQLFDFLKQLKEKYDKTTGVRKSPMDTPYATAPGYIHQELGTTVGCQEQTLFCSNNGNKDKYVFRSKPKDHDDACGCTSPPSAPPKPPAGPPQDRPHDDRARIDRGDTAPRPTPPPEAKKEEVDPNICDIVGKALKDNTALTEACKQKYAGNNSRLGWKCIPTKPNDVAGNETARSRSARSVDSAPNGKDTGGICIPPRRRKLYVGGLTKWVESQSKSQDKGDKQVEGQATGSEASQSVSSSDQGKEGTEASSTSSSVGDQLHPNGQMTSESSDKNPQVALLKAFVESAAVETFFLWHKYKKLKDIEDIEKKTAEGKVTYTSDVGKSLQEELEKGEIPEEFKRQMFYTLGDYRDILLSGSNTNDSVRKDTSSSNDNLKNIVVEASGKENEATMKKIQEAIDDHINKLKEITTGKPGGQPSSQPVKETQNPTELRENLWSNYAPSIWEAMICALTYKDGDNKPIQDEKVRAAFFGDETNKPGLNLPTLNGIIPPGKSGGTFKTEYNYSEVSHGGSDTTAIQAGNPDRLAGNGTKLEDFVKRPTYFRWLEEWADEFCRKQKHKLYIIKKDCRGKNGEKQYSGDGLDCNEPVPEKKDIFKGLEGPSCAKSCRWYRKWIRRKKIEFTEQSNAYNGQKEKCKKEGAHAGLNNDGNGFCETLQENAAQFLERLKNGPCKTNNDNDDNNEEHKIEFDKPQKTFRPAANCKPCSKFKIDCKSGNCGSSANGNKCNSKDGIDAKDIKTMIESGQQVDMLVSDDSAKEFQGGLQEACKDANIFKGIRKEEWKCGEVCGLDVCGLKNGNGVIDEKQIILVRALIKRWLEYFLEDYIKIIKKLKSCIENGKGSKCICGCDKKCNCVDKWINQKRTEWEEINKHYIDQNTKNSADTNNLSSFLQQGLFHNEVQKAIKPCHFTQFKTSCGLNGSNPSETERGKDNNDKDLVLCLITKLENLKNKISECTSSPSVQPQTACQNPHHVEDVDDDDIETENTENMRPNICPKVDDKPKQVEDEKCEAAPFPSTDTGSTSGGPGEKKKEKEKEEQDGAPELPGPADSDAASPPQEPAGEEPTNEVEPDKVDTKSKPPKPLPRPQRPKPTPQVEENPFNHPDVIPSLASSTLAWSVGIGFVALSYWWLKKKTKRPVDLFTVLEIPQNDYEIPTLKSSNKYIPYASAQYRGQRYIYLEGDSGTDSGYTDHYSDITSSSESEYEEFDINDIYVPGSPKYKTLIEVVLEPSKRDIQNDDIPSDDIPNSGNTIPNSGNTIPTSDNTIPTSGNTIPTSDTP
ncbi:erythrocyte membrane protein 1, EMP1, partial [Plasmodium reichenowi]